ncbi:DUF1877 family protein [Pedobacter frigoris]|uniref:DUF1877 family protein n=1 Tax=Pedobacter frigoris TaxID=2571272 RepID=UPI0029306F69|nr:DUF1877 family protein [Pedobacter frigoris]
MSISVTFYRLSEQAIKRLNESLKFDADSAKSYATFNGSLEAVAYLLSKQKDNSIVELLNEILSPKQAIGIQDLSSLDPLELFELYSADRLFPYLSPQKISKLLGVFSEFSATDISSAYNSNELNMHKVYPEIWHDDNSENQAYNERHLLDDFERLKKIFSSAKDEQDYILVFTG